MFFIRGNLFEFSMSIVYEYTIKKKNLQIFMLVIYSRTNWRPLVIMKQLVLVDSLLVIINHSFKTSYQMRMYPKFDYKIYQNKLKEIIIKY